MKVLNISLIKEFFMHSFLKYAQDKPHILFKAPKQGFAQWSMLSYKTAPVICY